MAILIFSHTETGSEISFNIVRIFYPTNNIHIHTFAHYSKIKRLQKFIVRGVVIIFQVVFLAFVIRFEWTMCHVCVCVYILRWGQVNAIVAPMVFQTISVQHPTDMFNVHALGTLHIVHGTNFSGIVVTNALICMLMSYVYVHRCTLKGYWIKRKDIIVYVSMGFCLSNISSEVM